MQVDLKTQLVHIEDKLILRNTGSAAAKSFLYCLPSKHVERLAHIAVRLTSDELTKSLVT